MIPKPSDIPDLDTPLTTAELSGVLKALDPKLPWTPKDAREGRKVGGFMGAPENTPDAAARFESLSALGWVVEFRYQAFSRSTDVYVRKPNAQPA